jgi:hypothetical protein
MKGWLTWVLLSCFFLPAEAQLKSHTIEHLNLNYTGPHVSNLTTQKYSSTVRQKFASPRLSQTLSTSHDGVTNYWTSQVTSQSYGNGKWGTYYYWDVQGNLREMRGFVDLAGKNKRGLKLVFPWH